MPPALGLPILDLNRVNFVKLLGKAEVFPHFFFTKRYSSMMRMIFLAAMISLLMLTGCATGYGPKGLGGGYTETKLDEQTYIVTYAGNGHTSSDAVWNYWIYRCAELTMQKGFTGFTINPLTQKTSQLEEIHDGHAVWLDMSAGSDANFLKVKGTYVPTYIYTPGYTVTTYRASSIVKMHKSPYTREVPFVFEARSVLSSLKSYVDAGGKGFAPARKDILDKAAVSTASGT